MSPQFVAVSYTHLDVYKRQVYVISNEEEKMEIREMLSESRAEFSRQYNIPVRTLENWESGKSSCPEYVRQLLEKAVREDVMSQ